MEYDCETAQSMAENQDMYWREKEKTLVNTKVYAHSAVIALKSAYFSQYFKEQHISAKKDSAPLQIDFNGQVMYEAFRKIIDCIYLDDLNVLD